VRFWASDVPGWALLVDLAAVAGLLAVATLLVRWVPLLRRWSVPVAILAGLIGLGLGPSGAGLMPLHAPAMEFLVYHAFALMFVAVGLQSAPRQRRPGAARSLAVANATVGVTQAILGFTFVAAWLAIEPLHPGFGLMIMLGFQQGPGQALSLGGAWEAAGMTDGAQIGLVFATLGFVYCFVLGVPAVAIARRRGMLTAEDEVSVAPPGYDAIPPPSDPDSPVGQEPLSMQLVIMGCVYLGVFGAVWGLVSLLPAGGELGETLWGLHFIVGSLLAIAVRRGARRLGHDGPFHDGMLARISVVGVELTTAGSIAAVRLDVLGAWLVPILIMTLVAGVLTLLGCWWLARRAFPEAPFAHALVLFGMGTGTLSTGLALLRMLDPELRGPVARNAVIGATASIPFNTPMFLVIIPLIAVPQWGNGTAAALGIPLIGLGVYLAALLVSWRLFTPFRLLRPLASPWPPLPAAAASTTHGAQPPPADPAAAGLAGNEAVAYIPASAAPSHGSRPRSEETPR
jgi:glutamate:Na+ symporter, ESS family